MTRSAPSPSREAALGSLPVLLEYHGRRWRISAGLLVEGLLLGTILTVPLLFPDRFPVDPRTPQLVIIPPRRGTPEGKPNAGPRGPRPRRDETQLQAIVTVPPRIPETIGTPTDAPAIPGGGGGHNPDGGPPGVPWGIEGGPGPVDPAQTTAGPPKPAPPVLPVGGQIRQPRLLRRVEPDYPRLAIAARIEGDVVLTAIIETDGRVRHLAVKSGHPSLAPAAQAAVAQWLYEPTTLNGQPVAVQLDVTVKFRLNR